MTDLELNKDVKLAPYDRLVAGTLLKLLPKSVRPNQITIARMVTSPVVFWLLWAGYYKAGLIAFLLVAVTDAMDGALARTRRQITVWGTTYDGIADKFLIGGVVLIVVLKHLGLTLVTLVVVLELLALVGALYYKHKGIVHPANVWGKIKMNLQVLATVALLIDVIWGKPIFSIVSLLLFVSSLIFGIISIIAHARKL